MIRPTPWLLLGLLAACSSERGDVQASPTADDSPASTEATPSAGTRWVPAVPASGLAWLEGPGRALATPSASAVVSVPLSARVLRVRVQPGQRVREGDPLVDVVMPELIRAAGSLRAADLRLGYLQQRHARVLPLLEQGLARAAEVAELDAAIATARADREGARATLRSAGESDAHALALIDGSGACSLRAPLSGMVVAVTAQLGQVREPAGGPLVELVGESALQIEAHFTTEPPAQVQFEWLELERRLPLVLDAVSPRAGNDGTRSAWLHLASTTDSPVPGALGRVRMIAPDDWLVVPVAALRESAGGLSVEVQRSGGSADTKIQLIRRSQTEAVITGLTPGTLVAADAARVREPGP